MRLPELRRYPAALTAGLALALAFPLPGWSGLAWVGPGLLAFTVLGLPWRQAFRLGYAAGLVWFAVSLRWLLSIPHPAGSVAAWIALSAYVAVYPALWAVGIGIFMRTDFRDGALVPDTWVGWRESIRDWTRCAWRVRVGVGFLGAAWWVALELARGWVIGGFPWNFLGSSQFRSIPLIQCASYAGVYGVSFLVCWGSLALAGALAMVTTRPDNRWGWTAELRLPLITIMIVAALGVRAVFAHSRQETLSVRMALVQPSIPQTLIWDASANSNRFGTVKSLSVQALAQGTEVLVWPEGSLPDISRDQFGEMTRLVKEAQVPWVFGADDVEGSGADQRFFNSAFLMGTDAGALRTYRKRRLVIFGEFIPFERWLPFMKYLTPVGGSFTPGGEPVVFDLGAVRGKAAPVICFEDTFPNGTRSHALAGADFLLELTNDGWFGEGSGQWQHLASALFRAVENGIPLVRCTNNGITCWIDRHGRIVEILGDGPGSYYARGVLHATVPVGDGGRPTFYRLNGDLFAWMCVVASVWSLLRRRLRSATAGQRPPDAVPT